MALARISVTLGPVGHAPRAGGRGVPRPRRPRRRLAVGGIAAMAVDAGRADRAGVVAGPAVVDVGAQVPAVPGTAGEPPEAGKAAAARTEPRMARDAVRADDAAARADPLGAGVRCLIDATEGAAGAAIGDVLVQGVAAGHGPLGRTTVPPPGAGLAAEALADALDTLVGHIAGARLAAAATVVDIPGGVDAVRAAPRRPFRTGWGRRRSGRGWWRAAGAAATGLPRGTDGSAGAAVRRIVLPVNAERLFLPALLDLAGQQPRLALLLALLLSLDDLATTGPGIGPGCTHEWEGESSQQASHSAAAGVQSRQAARESIEPVVFHRSSSFRATHSGPRLDWPVRSVYGGVSLGTSIERHISGRILGGPNRRDATALAGATTFSTVLVV